VTGARLPIVLAYHGCDLETAQQLLGGSPFLPSKEDYDWLGEGSYFWENDAVRAFQWATEPRRKFDRPSAVGAAIELGNCLDLTTQSGIDAVKVAYDLFIAMAEETGTPTPKNEDPARDRVGDKILRRLDCAVINYLFEILRTAQESDPKSQPYTTIRALFPEGSRLYPDAGFWDKTHIQICIREPRQILGVFQIPEWQRKELGLPRLYECL
jgi:hypothetical protein